MLRRLALATALSCACQPGIPDAIEPVVVAALYDPLAKPPVLPAPHEGTLQPGTAFPTGVAARIAFSGAIDPSTVTPESLIVADATDGIVFATTSYVTTLDPDGKAMSITRHTSWRPGHRALILLFGGDDAMGVRGASGEPAIASPYIFYLRQQEPILGVCETSGTGDCACPEGVVAAAAPDDFTCRSVVAGLADEDARVMERDRRAFGTELERFLPGSRNREHVIIGWSFPVSDL